MVPGLFLGVEVVVLDLIEEEELLLLDDGDLGAEFGVEL